MNPSANRAPSQGPSQKRGVVSALTVAQRAVVKGLIAAALDEFAKSHGLTRDPKAPPAEDHNATLRTKPPEDPKAEAESTEGAPPPGVLDDMIANCADSDVRKALVAIAAEDAPDAVKLRKAKKLLS